MQNASDYYSDTFGERPHFHIVVFFATESHTENDFKKCTKKCPKKLTLLLHFLLRYMCHISCPRINFHKFDSGP